jgi:acyl-coenzyme A thioesterase PaaI-like protein
MSVCSKPLNGKAEDRSNRRVFAAGIPEAMNTPEALIHEFPPTAQARALAPFPFVERVGLELLLSERGRAVIRLPIEPNINHVGTMYAGALFTLAEAPGGALFLSAFDLSRFFPIVGDLNIRFLEPATTSVLVDSRMGDDEIERITWELEATGKAKWVLDQELVDEQGVVVATTRATYFGRAI